MKNKFCEWTVTKLRDEYKLNYILRPQGTISYERAVWVIVDGRGTLGIQNMNLLCYSIQIPQNWAERNGILALDLNKGSKKSTLAVNLFKKLYTLLPAVPKYP